MYDYSRLPTLVLNQIFGYLSVKERIRAKSVCRTWREEIELRERKSDTLVLHFGPYLWNMRWSETNNRRLMKFENSFEMKNLNILKHPLTRDLLEKTKKLAIVCFNRNNFVQDVSHLQPYLGFFEHCEQIELRGLRLEGTLSFKLPKLKVLVFNNCSPNKLVLNCPSLEVLFWDQKILEIDFRSATKLKRLICFGWPAKVSLKGKLQTLEYLNLYAAQREPVNDRLLDQMPKLKRLVIYSSNPQADLVSIRQQQKRLGLKNLEVLFSGFREPVAAALSPEAHAIMYMDHRVGELFENYSKLAESSPWKVSIDYVMLFNQFKILPSDFFERFRSAHTIEISEVTNYTHLFGFLKCYPFVDQLNLHWRKAQGDRVLDLARWLLPSLTRLTIVEDRPSDVLAIDLSFLRFFNLAMLFLESTRLPLEFLRKVVAMKGPHFQSFGFEEITTHYGIVIYFNSQGLLLVDFRRRLSIQFSSLEKLISGMQKDAHLSALLL